MNSTACVVPSEQLTVEAATAEFQAGVTAVLRSWSAFRTAVESGWGGVASNEKAEFLRSHIFECFDYKKSKPSVDVYELEDNLAIYLEEEFSVVLEDDSEKQVAEVIWKMFDMCGKGDFSLSREIINCAKTCHNGNVVVESHGEIDDDSDEEMETNPQSNLEIRSSDDFLFGAPSGQINRVRQGPPPRQLGEPEPEKAQPEVDEDGFTMIPQRKGKK